jgi:hypothetical protein
MYSPDDPIFFLHHCNIDRLYHLWMDCHDYENISPQDITTTHYEALNPSGSGPGQQNVPVIPPTVNSITNEVYEVTVDTEIPFAYNYPSDNVVFPKPWPTPRDMWNSVNGYNGYNVRYGPDYLVTSFGESCTNNQQWTFVNYETSQQRSISKSHPHKDKIKKQADKFKKEISSGKSKREAIRELAIEECTDAPKLQITPKLLEWIEMNHLSITAFDTLCDQVSKKLPDKVSKNQEHTNNETNNLNEEITDKKSSSSITVESEEMTNTIVIPLWVIITLCTGIFVCLVAVIVLVVLYVRKNKVKYVDDSYREIVDVRKLNNK